MNDPDKVIEDSKESFKDIKNKDSSDLNDSSDELIVRKHSPLNEIKEPSKLKLDYRIPSPPKVVKTEYIVKEYKGIPKREESTCLIEKRISFKEESLKPKKSEKDKQHRETRYVNNSLLIGGGIVGALFGAYVLSGGNSE